MVNENGIHFIRMKSLIYVLPTGLSNLMSFTIERPGGTDHRHIEVGHQENERGSNNDAPLVSVPEPTNGENILRFFTRNDIVHVKLHCQNGWKWTSGVAVKRIRDGMFSVLIEDRRRLRSRVNQLRSHHAAGPIPNQ